MPAQVTSVGVFDYQGPDGRTVREYRAPSEVFHADSVASLRDAPVTRNHPPRSVTVDTWDRFTIGHVSGEASPKTDGISTALLISAPSAIQDVESGKLVECSCGYDADIVVESGMTPEGERYDARQTNIRYNHVALLPRGMGRQGAKSSLRLDAAGNQVEYLEPEKTPMKLKFRIDAKTVREADAGTPEAGELQAKQDAYVTGLEAENTTLKADRDTQKGRADAAEANLVKAKKELDEAPARLREDMRARGELEKKAVAVLGPEYKCDGKKDRDIMVDVIRKDDATYDPKDATDAYIRGRFDGVSANGRQDSAARSLETSAGVDDLDKKRADAQQASRDSWKQDIPGAVKK